MKKITCVLLLSCLITAAGFSLSETYISIGYENESNLGVTRNFKYYGELYYMNSSGVNITVNQYWNQKKIGLFIQQSFLFPTYDKYVGEKILRYTVNDYRSMFKYNVIIGPSFRFPLKNNFSLNLGTGLSFTYIIGFIDTQNTFFIGEYFRNINLGLGANLSFNYEILDFMYIGIGSAFDLKVDFDFGIKPYIYIGFKFYNYMGKPKQDIVE